MVMFGPAHTLFSYLISFAFIQPQNALKFISLAYMLSGFIIPFILKMIAIQVDHCEGTFYLVTQFLSQAIPLQPMSQGLTDMIN